MFDIENIPIKYYITFPIHFITLFMFSSSLVNYFLNCYNAVDVALIIKCYHDLLSSYEKRNMFR